MSGRIKEIKIPATIRQAVEQGEPLSMVEKITGTDTILMALEVELTKLSSMVNIDSRLNLQSNQLQGIAKSLLQLYKTESLEDFMLCFNRGSMGLYGSIFRLDGAVLTDWMRQYLDEKYQEVESKLMEEKEDYYKTFDGVSDQFFEDWKKELGYKPDPNGNTNAKENRYQKERLGIEIKPVTKEDMIAREMHKMYLLDNYDPLTGKKKKCWKLESEWLLDQGKEK